MTPAEARQALNKDASPRFSSSQVKTNLRLSAIMIYNHQKLAPRYQSKVQDGANTLAYLVCAAYGFEPPANDETLSTSAFGDTKPFKLCHWESLYYTLLAEIRNLYNDIQQYFQDELADGAFVLHNQGWDGTVSNSPWTALNMASQLEELWLLLMDACLIGPLDETVRIEQFAEKYREEYGDEAFRAQFAKNWAEMSQAQKSTAIEEVTGMVDTHSMVPAEVIDMIWQRHIPLVRRACRENFQKDIPFTIRLAEYRLHPFIEDIPPDQLENALCTCEAECHCRLVCQFEVSGCSCKEKSNNIRRSVWWQEKAQAKARAQLDPSEMRHMLGATTNNMAHLQITSKTDHYAERIQAIDQTTDETAYHDAQALYHQKQRDRANSNRSDLAYVPGPKTPSRGRKDAFPLDFYGSSPGGRYPKFRTESAKYPQPVYGASCYTTNIPSRKPVPGRISTATETETRGSSFETSSPLTPLDQAQIPSLSSDVTHPSIQHSTSKNLLTQSFPVVAAGNPREPENEFATWNTTDAASPDVPARSSAKFTQSLADGKVPFVRHSADSPQPRWAQSKIEIPPMEKPLPVVAETLPEFIAPRPALKQRYVSAGGYAKLKDRPEIQDFTLPASLAHGIAMSKEELLQKLQEQDAGVRRDSAFATPRHSQDTGAGVDKSQRSSREIDELVRGEKRVRTGSTSSFRKLKRVFSRQNSQSE